MSKLGGGGGGGRGGFWQNFPISQPLTPLSH